MKRATKTKAGTKTPAVGSAAQIRAAKQEVLSLRGAAIKATVRGSVKELSRLATDDFVFVDVDGDMMVASDCFTSLEETVSNPDPTDVGMTFKVKSFTVDNVVTRVFGETVIETMLYTDNIAAKNSGRAKAFSVNRTFRVTSVWVRQGEAFRLASAQMTPVQVGA